MINTIISRLKENIISPTCIYTTNAYVDFIMSNDLNKVAVNTRHKFKSVNAYYHHTEHVLQEHLPGTFGQY